MVMSAGSSGVIVGEFTLFLRVNKKRQRFHCAVSISKRTEISLQREHLGIILLDSQGRLLKLVSAPPAGPLREFGSTLGATVNGTYEFVSQFPRSLPKRAVVFLTGSHIEFILSPQRGKSEYLVSSVIT
jgi:hypothetical protein